MPLSLNVMSNLCGCVLLHTQPMHGIAGDVSWHVCEMQKCLHPQARGVVVVSMAVGDIVRFILLLSAQIRWSIQYADPISYIVNKISVDDGS